MAREETRESVREARNAVYRELVFEAAEMTFAARGFDATKIQDIADRAGVSVGVLYGVYSGKQELFEAIHAERCRCLLSQVDAAIHAAETPVDKILVALATALRFFADHPHYLRMHLRESTAWAYPGTGAGRDIQAAAWKDGHRLAASIYEAGVAAGTLVPEEPVYAGRILMAMTQMHLAEWYQNGMETDVETEVARLEALARRAFVVQPAK